MVTKDLCELLGPLTNLVGVWEGSKGDDIAPSDDRGTENNKYRERIVFEDAGIVQNHEQSHNVLRYHLQAFRIGEDLPFHDEIGYWTWEPANQTVMRCLLIPRGVAVIAGGKAKMDAREFRLRAECGSTTFGICSNPFLDKEFKTESFEMVMKIHDHNSFSYEQDTVIRIAGQKELFHHRDRNTLTRIS